MSIVPYNQNNQIVYHDANYGLLVLHNNQENTFQLLSTNQYIDGSIRPNETDQEKNRYHKNDGHNQCPNCGFIWDDLKKPGRRNSNSPAYLSDTPAQTQQSNSNLSKRLPQLFIHRDYFKLLGKLPYQSDEKYETLPRDIYNQGYFEKFFVKIPPYILGSGAHSQVYKVMHVLNDIKLGVYALKRISIGDKFEFLEHVLNEVLILYELSAKCSNENNLIRYNHVWIELGDLDDLTSYILPDKGKDLENKKLKIPYVFILQQYCGGGHLEDLINKNFQPERNLSLKEKVHRERQRRRTSRNGIKDDHENKTKNWLSDFEIWKFFTDVAKGVHYLHSHGILHRDLKPSNCLLDVKYSHDLVPSQFNSSRELENFRSSLPSVLVSDFGEGKFINKHHLKEEIATDEKGSNERRGNTGTLEFTAPELWLIINHDPNLTNKGGHYIHEYTFESDIYSLGLILCWLCFGKLPFSDRIENENDPKIIRQNITDWYYTLDPLKLQSWIKSEVIERGNFDNEGFFSLLGDFMYLMIKGSYDPEKDKEVRIPTSDILIYLHEMKRSFLVNNYHYDSVGLSAASIVSDKFDNSVDDIDNDTNIDGETIDLFKIKSSTNSTLKDSVSKEFNLFQESSNLLQLSFCFLYVSLLISIEFLLYQSELRRVFLLPKVSMLLSMVLVLKYPLSLLLQVLLLSFNIVLGVLTKVLT